MLVVTCNSFGPGSFDMLEKSCERYSYPLSFYSVERFLGFRHMKLDALTRHLKTLNTDLVMYTDSTDSWFLKPNIEEIYKDNFNNQVVVSGNRDHYPHTTLYSDFPESPTSMRYICCSQFIGPLDKVISTLETISTKWVHGDTDQEGWHYCHTNAYIDIEIDHYCKLFLNMTNVGIEELTTDFKFVETNTYPASIHFGGPKGNSPNGIMMKNKFEEWKRIE